MNVARIALYIELFLTAFPSVPRMQDAYKKMQVVYREHVLLNVFSYIPNYGDNMTAETTLAMLSEIKLLNGQSSFDNYCLFK